VGWSFRSRSIHLNSGLFCLSPVHPVARIPSVGITVVGDQVTAHGKACTFAQSHTGMDRSAPSLFVSLGQVQRFASFDVLVAIGWNPRQGCDHGVRLPWTGSLVQPIEFRSGVLRIQLDFEFGAVKKPEQSECLVRVAGAMAVTVSEASFHRSPRRMHPCLRR
jgi:hypothetical protein